MSTVQNIVDAVKYRINNTTFTGVSGVTAHIVPLINDILRAIDMWLLWEKSELAETPFSIPFAAGVSSADLPAGFQALTEPPWIEGATRRLLVLPGRETGLGLTDAGTPRYYELTGSSLVLYPPPEAAVTLKGNYFRFSAPMVDETSVVPHAGLFDQVIQEYLVKLYHLSNTTRDETGQAMAAFDEKETARFKSMVRQVLFRRNGMPKSTVQMRRWV